MYKSPAFRTQITGVCLALSTAALVACGDSGTSTSIVDDEANVATGNSQTDGVSTDSNIQAGGTDISINSGETATAGSGTDIPTGGDGTSDTADALVDTVTGSQNTDAGANEVDTPAATQPVTNAPDPDTADTAAAIATGSDISGSDDDSPTETESASLIGPFTKDTTRSAGPPSVPVGLTLLLAAENWLEFSWQPSSDDQSVEGYEVYRDGTLVYTIRGDTGYEFDYRSWITTSYIDCNYTRYSFCGDNPIVAGSSYEYRVVAVDNEGMKSAPSEPAVFQLATRESGSADLSDYVQVFSEEFNGDGLDRSKWKTSLPWGPNEIINAERQYFVNTFGNDPLPVDPFVFTGSTLQITGTNTPPELLDRANNQPFLSGVITTSDNFEMTYGYVEMNAKVTGGDGFLSTFYMFNQDYEKNKPEIDIIEFIGSRPDKAYQTYHYFDSNRNRWASGERHSSPTMETVSATDLTAGFHTYGVLWEPGLVVWYIDGSEVRRLTGVRVSDEPMNIIAQLVVGSEWIGEPNAADLPKTFEIDYIRAWQKQ